MNLSMSSPTTLVGYCLLVFLASLTGGWLPTVLHLTHTRLQAAVSGIAGLMLGLSVLNLLPHAVEELGSVQTGAAWMLAGFLTMFLLQRFLPFHHHNVEESDEPNHEQGHEHDHGHERSHDELPAPPLRWIGVAFGLSLHSLFDGLALAAAVMATEHGHSGALGLATALAVILHKPFGAMAITTLMKASDAPRGWYRSVNTAFALVTPVGALLFFLGASHLTEMHPAWLGMSLAFCGGTFLCIACADLLPELQFHSHDRIKLSVALFIGLTVAILIGKFGHTPHEHAHDSPSEVPPPTEASGQ